MKKVKDDTKISEEKPSSAGKTNGDPVSSISSKEKDDIITGKKDLQPNENKLPVPSTSAQSCSTFDAENEASKIYKKSLAFLQFQWCKQQPDFIKLRQEVSEKHK